MEDRATSHPPFGQSYLASRFRGLGFVVQGSAHVHGLVQTPQRHVMGGSHRIHVACGKRSENGD